MNYESFNAFCESLSASTYVMQWGGCHVWKIGGKVYAIGGWHDERPAYTFKVSPMAYEILSQQPGLRPAPYLASRGMKWIQHCDETSVNDEELKEYIKQSYEIVASGLSKKLQRELGFL